ncbi:unnamed protein product [Prunus armeniaca]
MYEDLVLKVKSIAKKSSAVGLEENRQSERPDDDTCLLAVGGAHDVIPPPFGLKLGLKLPSGQPVFVGPTPNTGLGSSLELGFFFSPQIEAGLLAGVALRKRGFSYTYYQCVCHRDS